MKNVTYEQSVCFSMTSIFGVSLHSLWEMVVANAPGWTMVPPILVGVASLAGAVMSGMKAREDILAGRAKRAEEKQLHEARMRRVESISESWEVDT